MTDLSKIYTNAALPGPILKMWRLANDARAFASAEKETNPEAAAFIHAAADYKAAFLTRLIHQRINRPGMVEHYNRLAYMARADLLLPNHADDEPVHNESDTPLLLAELDIARTCPRTTDKFATMLKMAEAYIRTEPRLAVRLEQPVQSLSAKAFRSVMSRFSL